MKRNLSVERLLNIGVALSKEKNDDALLEAIVMGAMEITNCDGAVLYIKNGSFLEYQLVVIQSLGIYKGGRQGPAKLPPMPLANQNACAAAVLENRLINIYDAAGKEWFAPLGLERDINMKDYTGISQLLIPLEDDYGDVIGGLQLINAQTEAGRIVPFNDDDEQVVYTLASHAAVCLTNMNLSAEVVGFLDSFVRVMSMAIDARSPYNANHTRNMIRYLNRFLDWLKASGNSWQISRNERRQLLMSIWLHDIGKLVVPLAIMDKETRLGERLQTVSHRFEVAKLTNRIAFLEGEISRPVYEERQVFLNHSWELVQRSNSASFLTDEDLAEILTLSGKTYIDADWQQKVLLEEEDLVCLSLPQGTLTEAERQVMEGHVEMTKRMLDEMVFSRNYQDVPKWAAAHHELLDGSGYPRHLRGEEIPPQVRLITILDIFDALTAYDRPYKSGMPVEQAFEIMDAMVARGKLDENILALYKESQAWIERGK